MNVIKAFLFDMDGVVADTEPQYDIFLEKLGAEYQLSADFLHQVKGIRLPDILTRYFSHFPEEEIKKASDKIMDFELNKMKYLPISGVIEFIEQAKQKGFKIGLVTSSSRVKTEVALKKLKLEHTFAAVVTGDDVERGKPAPECYLLGAERLKAAPEECLVFEDSFAGIEAGIQAGMTVVGVATTNTRESLQGKVDKIIPDFKKITVNDLLQ